MSKAEERAYECFPNEDIESKKARFGFLLGYHQAEKDVVEAFAKIVCSNLSMIDKSVQDMFEQLYTNITGEKMYKGFQD